MTARPPALAEEAARILQTNDRGGYSIPTAGLYPMQFNWDSAFAALGYRKLDPDRAWQEIETLLAAQHDDGMIPHIVFRGDCRGYFPGADVWQAGGAPPTSGITQPPVAAMAARRIFDLHGAPQPAERLDSMIRRLATWHEWFSRSRRDPGTGAALVTHPWESGRDNSPDWDAAMARVKPEPGLTYQRADLDHVDAGQRPHRADYDRYLTLVRFGVRLKWQQDNLAAQSPFRMLDPLITAVLARADSDLARLAADRGMTTEAEAAERRAAAWQSGLRALWSDGAKAVVARNPDSGEFSSSPTAASLLAPLAGIRDERILAGTLALFDRMASQTRFGAPSADPSCPEFDPCRYWKGPVWAVINRLIGWGLEDMGETARAAKLRRDTADLAAQSGFWEYYDPLTGEGLGGSDFTWTAAVYLDWAGEEGR